MAFLHTCIKDDGGYPGRRCLACEAERERSREIAFTCIGYVTCLKGDCAVYCGACSISAVLANGAEARTPNASSKQRPGDQPLPLSADGPSMQDLVIADIEERKKVGLERYGQLLMADDGRDNLLDAYQEALDLCVYLRKELYRRDRR